MSPLANSCKKAIIPVAGFGTRRLPITKAVEKCMLPVGNRPLIDYVVEDCIKAGVEEFYFVVGEEFQQLKRYYGHNQLLEEYLQRNNKIDALDEILAIGKEARFHYVIQDQHQPYGTAVPIALCSHLIAAEEQVLVAGGDDFIYNENGKSELGRLLEAVANSTATAGMLAATIPREEVSRYGTLQTRPDGKGYMLFEKVVEHASPETAPSNLINITKFVFDKTMLSLARQVLERPPAANGEYQLTEALNLYAQSGKPIIVLPAEGEYLDGGTTEGWLYANNRIVKK
ncbi:MAG TPA: sugar phosphate nucleotidyltransferase [Candidatus Saccharimonadales bacterium]|nr:sugar phosphate nucleotidyltransferase [Candidatus Saccharimonadales bacterium]